MNLGRPRFSSAPGHPPAGQGGGQEISPVHHQEHPGSDRATGDAVHMFSAKTQREKLAQRQFFFWYKPEERRNIVNELRRIGRSDLIDKLYGGNRGGRK